jgi:predicted metal-dependent RNase
MKKFDYFFIIILFWAGDIMMYAQDITNEGEMVKEFKKIILKREDFNESITKLHESCFLPSQFTYEFIGKPEILAKDDKICYVQAILLKNNINIHADYMVLQTQEDAVRAMNYFVSDTAEIAHALYINIKEEIGLEKYAAAYYYQSDRHTTLVFQCKNIFTRVSVHAENVKKDENETIKICRHLAKTIIKRINNNNNNN